jgi:hypothetical protein
MNEDRWWLAIPTQQGKFRLPIKDGSPKWQRIMREKIVTSDGFFPETENLIPIDRI